jgi:hypothetical protein
MTTLFRSAAALAVAAVLAADAPAGLTFVVTPASSSARVGETVDVDVFLRETSDTGDFVLLDEGGLISGGVKLSAAGPGTVTLTDPAAIAGNPAFPISVPFVGPDELTGTPGEVAGLFVAVDLFDPAVPPNPIDPTTVEVFLGTFTLAVGGPAGTAATVTASAIDPGVFFGNVTEAGTDLDALGIAPATATITAVPGPASLALAGVGAAGLAVRLRRRSARA